MSGSGLEQLLAWSEVVLVARVGADGTIEQANEALERTFGAPVEGRPVAELVTQAQRPALEQLIAVAPAEGVLGLVGGPRDVATDHRVRVVPDGDGVLVLAEPAVLEQGRLLEQVLELNGDLIATRREAELARAAHERANQRLRFLESVGSAILRHARLDDVLAELVRLIASALEAEHSVIALSDPETGDLVVRAVLGGSTEVGEPAGPAARGILASGVEVRRESAGVAIAGVPLRAGDVTGVAYVASRARGAYTDDDVALLRLMSQRATLAIARASADARHREIGHELQRSLLPERLPDVPGLTLAARYAPSGHEMQVGGDWFDAIVLPDGCVLLTIGDVAGHGLPAAAAMGRLRAATHAYALEQMAPADVLERLNRLALGMDAVATGLCAALDPSSGRLEYASAGHPPPVVVTGGGARLLPKPSGTPLGLEAAAPGVASEELPAGATLVLFTDGVAERRGEPIDRGLERLCATAAGHGDPTELCERLLALSRADDGVRDDVAVLAVRRA